MSRKKSKAHLKINRVLAICVVLVGVYLVVFPIIPSVNYQLKATPSLPKPNAIIDPSSNRIVIPSAKVNSQVLEGPTISVIDHGGVWRRPLSSDSPNQGNMVIVGHNFTYTDPTPPFYALNNANAGDHLALQWKGALYNYRVVSKRIVSPTELGIEKPTDKPTLTLYSCYPLFVANKRVVIQAERL